MLARGAALPSRTTVEMPWRVSVLGESVAREIVCDAAEHSQSRVSRGLVDLRVARDVGLDGGCLFRLLATTSAPRDRAPLRRKSQAAFDISCSALDYVPRRLAARPRPTRCSYIAGTSRTVATSGMTLALFPWLPRARARAPPECEDRRHGVERGHDVAGDEVDRDRAPALVGYGSRFVFVILCTSRPRLLGLPLRRRVG